MSRQLRAAVGVVFDLDGTLVHTLPELAAATDAALSTLGLPPRPQGVYRTLIGGGLEILIRGALPVDQRTPARVAETQRLMLTAYRAGLDARSRPFPGIEHLLRALSCRQVPMAVLSNKVHRDTLAVVAALFPGVRFRAVIGLRDGWPAKPHPAVAHALATTMRVAPRRLVMVGDGDTDMELARNAGMYPLGASWGYRSAGQLVAAGAERLVATPQAAARLLLATFPGG